MCGIFCSISWGRPVWPSLELQELLQKRGPDSSGKRSVVVKPSPPSQSSQGPFDVHVTCFSTVLSLRGNSVVEQPLSHLDSDSILCWNGEAWSIAGTHTHGNDTERVFYVLLQTALSLVATGSRAEQVLTRSQLISAAMAHIEGPYAFVFHDAANDMLFFGRDLLGRRSLLIHTTEEGDVLISSVADPSSTSGWREVEADGVYCIDLRPGNLVAASDFEETKVPYTLAADDDSELDSVLPHLSLNKEVPSAGCTLDTAAPAVTQLERMLRHSLCHRVLGIPDPPALTVTHAMLRCSRLAILFSGGLDCTTLARLCHDLLPIGESIDLLNVAFENPRVHKTSDGSDGSVYELCPDRITGRTSHAELQRVCSERDWKFVAIDIPYSSTLEHRQKVIQLMHPHNTEMDLSISYALYFAARGNGYVTSLSGTRVPYATKARVLLSGLGADELFGGYQRHATAYNRKGYPGLIDELDLDIGRLGKRNLGRDDRIITNWGREARFPFLDERLVSWALSALVTDKCGFGEEHKMDITATTEDASHRLEPGKKVLRCLAWKLNMTGVAAEQKRAIQFGARTAKMETGRTKGTQALS